MLLLALACGATAESAAQKAGVSLRTVRRRLADPEFCRRLQQLRGEIVQRTTGTLTAVTGEAVRALAELLKPDVAPHTRLGAARAVLEMAMKMREFAEFGERLGELEQRFDEYNADSA
jgi:hypothetical protein